MEKEDNDRSKSQIKKTKFHIVVRIRPSEVGDEVSSGLYTSDDLKRVVARDGDNGIKVVKPYVEDKIFEFDKVLKPSINQKEAFNQIALNIIDDITDGYNGTIMAYGQTGSGKTYTIFGKHNSLDYTQDTGLDDDAGIVPRAVCHLFDKLRNEGKKIKFKITISFFQIYLEQITDLIPDLDENEEDSSNTKDKKKEVPMNFQNNNSSNIIKQAKKDAGVGLRIREDPKTGVFIEGLKQIQVENEEQLLGLIKFASKNRITHNTNMNLTSSRSHAILRILFEKRTYSHIDNNNSSNQNSPSKKGYTNTKGLLTIVDLAGSEKSKLSNAGIRKEESKYINSSIYHLGTVVYNLANNNHVNFRETSLTRVLKECISGNSKNSICATVSPFLVNYEETLTTLQFASQAKYIKISATRNVQHEIKEVKDQLYNMVNHNKNKALINNSKLSFLKNRSEGNNARSVSKVYSYPNSTREVIGNNLLFSKHNNSILMLNSNQSVIHNNTQLVNEEEYQVLNKKYFQMITFLQKELCQKESEIYSLLKENKELKAKLAECQKLNPINSKINTNK